MTERTAMILPLEGRLAHRQAVAAPIVAKIREWVDRWRVHEDVVRRPKSAFAKAVHHLHRQWATLELFLKRPEIELHNNRSELLLRGPVVGRLVQPGGVVHAPGQQEDEVGDPRAHPGAVGRRPSGRGREDCGGVGTPCRTRDSGPDRLPDGPVQSLPFGSTASTLPSPWRHRQLRLANV